MKTPLLDEPHTLVLTDGVLVITTMGSLSLRALVVDAFNRSKAGGIHLHLGEGFHWEIEREQLDRDLFEEELLDRMDDHDFPFNERGEIDLHVRLIPVD